MQSFTNTGLNPDHTNIQIATDPTFVRIAREYTGPYTESWVVDDLIAGTKYYVHARHSYPGDDFGAFGKTSCFTMRIPKPDKPMVIFPRHQSANVTLKPTVTVSASPWAENTQIQIATDINFAAIVCGYSGKYTQSWSLTTLLEPETTYFVRCSHSNAKGTSDFSDINMFKTAAAKPEKPLLLKPVDQATNVAILPRVDISSSSLATDTILQIANSSTFNNVISSYNGAYIQSWDSTTPLDYNTTYYVRGYHSNKGVMSDPSNVNVFTTMAQKPNKPFITTPFNDSENINTKPIITMSMSMAASTTKIQISKTQDFAVIEQEYDGVYTQSWEVPTDLARNTTYFVRGYHGNAGGMSDPSDVVKFKTVPEPPTQATITAPANNATNVALLPTVTISASTTASNTLIQISNDTSFNNIVASYTGLYTQSWTVSTALARDSTYYVRGQHSNAGGDGPMSTINTFKTVPNAPAKATILTPVNDAKDVILKPEVTISSTTGGTGTLIQIASDVGFQTITTSYTGDYVESWTPTTSLANATTYYVRGRHSNAGGDGTMSNTNKFLTVPNKPSKPSITYPTNNLENVILKPTITISAG